jgi:hypothetical protein
MIIGINGKIGSGKDTVGSIIQYLTYGADKANISYDNWDGQPVWGTEKNSFHKSSWEIKKFAGKLKTIASLLTGIPVEKFEDQEFKKQEMPECWNRLQQSGRSKVQLPMTYREFLQKLGTEAMRNGLHTNVWVNALFADYQKISLNWDCDGNTTVLTLPNWIITDMRFENELEAIVKKGGITIRVVRPGTVVGNHPSEVALDGFIMHYEIINDGTIEDLIEKVREILIKENII